MTAIGTPASRPASASTIDAGVAPISSARCDASWIVRPSITGSENGIPTSMASAPASATARTTSSQPRPRPPVTYGTSSLWPASRRARSVDSRFTPPPLVARPAASRSQRLARQHLGHLVGVLVATTGQGHEDRRTLRDAVTGLTGQPSDRVGRLECRDDALRGREQLESLERLRVGRRPILGAALRG